ncbi:MAG: hypothetical protein FD179_1412, partial [Erysipelotrichaceae bacterium]
EKLKKEYGTTSVLRYLGLNRSGYYKWVKRKDIKAGEILDGIGGYCVRGWIELHKVVREKKLIPIGLIEGNTYAKRDIPNGTVLTEDDVAVDTSTFIYRLRQEQDKIYG